MKYLIFLACCGAVIGCGSKPLVFSTESKGMIRKFDEHLDRHKVQTFEGLCKEVERLHDTKRISDEEFEALHRVCGPASTGQWDRAKEHLEDLHELAKASN